MTVTVTPTRTARQTVITYLVNNIVVGTVYGPTIPAGYQLIGRPISMETPSPITCLFSPSTRRTAIWYLNNNIFIGGAYGPTLP